MRKTGKTVEELQFEVECLQLFRSLIKDGCKWQGDIIHRKWSDELFFTEAEMPAVIETLSCYEEDRHFKLDDGVVFIG